MSRGGLLRAAAALAACAALAAAQDKPARNDPRSCPYCKGDPELLAKAGLVSHGPFPFGNEPNDTQSVDDDLAADVFWIESAHFEIGLGIGAYRVSQKDKDKLRGELGRLAQVLPAVDPKTKLLDEWLRAHLFAQRCEDSYQRFLELVRCTEADFPKAGEKIMTGAPYRGHGPHLGQAGKYEVLLLENEREQTTFLNGQFGLPVKRTQRYNAVSRDTLDVTIHLEQEGLRNDEALHGHVVFNLAHMFLDGYKHYSYDTPIWLHEGLAHFMEREVVRDYNTFDATEGGLPEETTEDRWVPEARKIAAGGMAPRMAELINLQSYAAITLEMHFTSWSMVDFMVREHPDAFACLLAKLKGRVKADGTPDSENLKDAHREAFSTCLGMTYAEFDRAWADWIATQVERKD